MKIFNFVFKECLSEWWFTYLTDDIHIIDLRSLIFIEPSLRILENILLYIGYGEELILFLFFMFWGSLKLFDIASVVSADDG